MSDEALRQKAEEYVKKDGTETEKLLNSVKLSLTREEATVLIKCIKQSYIDGATENGIHWHDLRKDPNDLPNDYRSVWTNKGGACHDNDGWYDDFGWVNGVIAWCEPQFNSED